MKKQIVLDTVIDDNETTVTVEKAAADCNVTVEVVEQYGPNGWPELRFTGKEDDLRKFILEWYCGGDKDLATDLEEYFETVK